MERPVSPRQATALRVLLERALAGDAIPPPVHNPDITDICIDSRRVTPGALFVAIPGTRADGAAFAADAAARGASALVVEHAARLEQSTGERTEPVVIRVAHARRAASRLAAAFTGLDTIQRQGRLRCIGVTGTNGKTTTTYMIRSILKAAGFPTALLGTIECDLVSRRVTSELTTPDPVALARRLVEAHDAGARFAVMEVSSHSLDQHRVDGIAYCAGVFTNLTQDHLDYHATIDDYLRAKRRLFEMLPDNGIAVVNGDDPAAEQILDGCRARVIRCTVADGQGHPMPEGRPPGPGSDFRSHLTCAATIQSQDLAGSRFRLEYDHQQLELVIRLAGRYNVQNALVAAATALALDVPAEAIVRGLAALGGVPGRLQRIGDGGAEPAVFVDYAHTDDALRNVLGTLRGLTRGRLWCVFGCGGDRDRTKRPRMARAVAEIADRFIITSDNPRTEDPLAIIAEIETGLSAADLARSETIPDRAAAIHRGIEQLSDSDALVIAGKGHEDYQIMGTTRTHFDDAEVAAAALMGRRKETT